ncbi:MAG: DUF3267 domain-containing protein [Bacilli bacterium]|nr:DUF3267 domain-containing protein [Bacilli bacterium]
MAPKTKYYFVELPENYASDYIIDGSSKKTRKIVTILFFVSFALTFVICEAINRFNFAIEFKLARTLVAPVVFVLAHFLMVVVHELIHGLFNKILTHEKLVFGFSLRSAYCGTPSIFVKKGAKMVIAMAPFFTLLTALVVPLVFVKDPFYYLLVTILLSFHVAGCSGDLMEFFILLFMYRRKEVLVLDTGPSQTIYVKSDKTE